MASPEFKVGDRVRISLPADPSADGRVGVVKMLNATREFPYRVNVADPRGRFSGVFRASELELVAKDDVVVDDSVNSPKHYTWAPVEVIELTEWLNFNLGNVVKYVARADHKGNPEKDLEKALWYLRREVERRKKHPKSV